MSGYKESVEKACELLKEAGARRAMLLNVSGPFHSELLKTAGEQLEQVLENITILDSKIPYYANVNAKSITDSNEVKTLLVKQVSSSVLWNQTMRQMIEDGITTFVEIGPGKTLSGFLKKCNKELKAEITIYSVEKIEDLENLEL